MFEGIRSEALLRADLKRLSKHHRKLMIVRFNTPLEAKKRKKLTEMTIRTHKLKRQCETQLRKILRENGKEVGIRENLLYREC